MDICETIGQKSAEAENGPLVWNESKSWRLDDFVGDGNEVLGFTLKAKSITGEIKVVSGSSSNEWFDIKYDPVTKILVLTPNSPQAKFIR